MKKIYTLIILALFQAFCLSYVNCQNIIALVGGTVIRTDIQDTIPNSVILMKGINILDIGPMEKIVIPENAQVIDIKGKFVIPGLIDTHIHFFQSGGLYTRPDAIDLRQRVPYKDKELKEILDNITGLFKEYISCGVTDVADLGGPMFNFDIRDKAAQIIPAPNVFVSGPLLASYQPEALTTDDPPIIRVSSIKQALELVQKQIEKKTDYIKIWYISSNNLRKNALDVNEFYPIVKAIVEESHKHNLPVFVHATELETARKAVQAGCDVLVHSVIDKEVDEDFLKLCKEKNIIYIPTLWVFKSYEAVFSKQLKLLKVEHLRGNPKTIGTFFDMYELSDSELSERAKKFQDNPKPILIDSVILKNLKKVHDYGITIAMGTDAGNIGVIHGPSIFREFIYMKQAGMSDFEILQSATLNGAKVLQRDKWLGSIEKGKIACMLVLNSNPLKDILNTEDIRYIVKNGTMIDGPSLLKKTPPELAQIQLNAYNARDIESFLSVYDSNVVVHEFPVKEKSKGQEEMRNAYIALFNRAPNLHCRLVNRITSNNFVIDQEKVSGIPGRGVISAVAMYEIKNGLISDVWFLP